MGLCGCGPPATAMSAVASRDGVAVTGLNSNGALISNGDKSGDQWSESPGGAEESACSGGATRVRRKRRHTCPDYRESPSPLENGWHGGGGSPGARLSPPPRLASLDASLNSSPATSSRRCSEGDGSTRASRYQDRPVKPAKLAKLAKLEACVKLETGKLASEVTPDKPLMNNGDRSSEPPDVDGDSEHKQEPPDRPGASPPPPPPPAADTPTRHRRNLTETEKLYLNSECHKTEILGSKLRHTACRLSGAAAATVTIQPPVLQPNGDEPAGKRRRRAPPPPRHRRFRCVDSPATDSESEGPPHLEPEAPLAAAPRGRGGRQLRVAPAPHLREAESEADAVSFSFQAAPDAEEWFRTFSRQEAGRRAVEDFSWAAAGGGQRLPYQMAAEELFPRELVPGGGRPRPLRPPTLPDRWLPPLPSAAAEAERAASQTAPPADWLCLEELCRVLFRAPGPAAPPPTEVEPPAAEVAAAITAWPSSTSLQELADALSGEPAEPAPDWAGPDTASEPSRPPSSADETSSVSTDASAGGGGRRRPIKRRKNRTGWPRARVKKSNLLKTAVSRAAAEAGAGCSREGSGPS